MKTPCARHEGWEVKLVPSIRYEPNPEWFPFAVTSDALGNFIWLRREKITFTMVGEDDNDRQA